jgi:uncharacterized alpha-E superfamily protein
VLLSRTADNLFWMSRYIERAESIARLIQVARRMAMTAAIGLGIRNEWESVIVIAGCSEAFYEQHETANARTVTDFLVFDLDNSVSLMAYLGRARNNARSARTFFTSDMWEALNSTWIQARERIAERSTRNDPVEFLEWVKERTMLLRGATIDTMLRDDAFIFCQLGTYISRATNTSRLLDVKYHVLLPEQESVGGAVDYYQWMAVLRSVSAHRSYHFVYKDDLNPAKIAEFLILRPEMPRSLLTCLSEVDGYLGQLAEMYGQRHECQRLSGELFSELRYGQIDRIFAEGLHEYLTRFVKRTALLSDEISRSYLS